MTLPVNEDLYRRIRQAWSLNTTSDPAVWTTDNPAWGQCAVTACLVQDQLGGDIVWAEAKLPDGRRISHYFNRIGGQELDLTREQFPAGTAIAHGVDKRKNFPSTRDYILSFAASKARYELLRARLKTKEPS